ncbi:MAG: YmdB family metallophosphoesterase [Clostridia bacterium]|nr:YmdB family metallophosphoesterase [Clostridia bacterium]
MCGPCDGILGVDTRVSIERLRTMMPVHLQVAKGDVRAMGAVFDVDESCRRVRSVKRIVF